MNLVILASLLKYKRQYFNHTVFLKIKWQNTQGTELHPESDTYI